MYLNMFKNTAMTVAARAVEAERVYHWLNSRGLQIVVYAQIESKLDQ